MNGIAQQVNDLYSIPFRNLSSSSMPAFGVGLVTGSNVSDQGLFIPSVEDASTSSVTGMIVNGPVAIASNGYGMGYWGEGPILALYDSTSTPAVGDTYGIKSGGTAFTLYKGYHGFTCISAATAGSGSEARGFFMPSWYERPPIVGQLSANNKAMAYSASTEIIVLNTKGGAAATNGVWPSYTAPNAIEVDNSTGRMTVRRSGFWKIDAAWSSEGPARFSAPYQSKTHRVGVKLYKNGSATNTLADYYHFSLANADTTPTGGVAMRVNGALSTGMYLATGDIIDLRLTVSEVTADSGTTTEGDVNFPRIEFMAQFVGAQQWRNDY